MSLSHLKYPMAFQLLITMGRAEVYTPKTKPKKATPKK